MIERIFLKLCLIGVCIHVGQIQAVEIEYIDYNLAASMKAGLFFKSDTISPKVIKKVDVTPNSNEKHIFNEENFVICVEDCNKADPFFIKDDKLVPNGIDDKTLLEVTNVYVHLKGFLEFAKNSFNIERSKKLVVIVNSETNEFGMEEYNNALYDSKRDRLVFLKAKSSLFNKVNRSGYDGSIIAHEAAHALMSSIIPEPRLSGKSDYHSNHEGLADFLSASYFENPMVGNVLLRGKPLRNLAELKRPDGSPKKISDVHGNPHYTGEAVSHVLFLSSKVFEDKTIFNLKLGEALKELANPFYYESILGDVFLPKLIQGARPETANKLIIIWNKIFDQRRELFDLKRTMNTLSFTTIQDINLPRSTFDFSIRETLTENYSYAVGLVKEKDFKVARVDVNGEVFYIVTKAAEVQGVYDEDGDVILSLPNSIEVLLGNCYEGNYNQDCSSLIYWKG